MTPQEALGILGLVGTPDMAEIERAFRAKQSELDENLLDTSVHKLKTRRLRLTEAYSLLTRQTLGGADVMSSAAVTINPIDAAPSTQPIFRVPSGLSATKLADLPGAHSYQTALGTGGNMTQIASLQPGHVLANRFEIKAQIGAGGMGAVYRAYDRNRGEDIAVKVMLPGLIASDTAKQRFINEAKISIKLSNQNIVNVSDVQIDGAYIFITMELLEGHTLRQAMDDKKKQRLKWSEAEVLDVVCHLCEALEYAHRYTVHRDIKPENVWINHDGTIKLMDFGIARLMTGSQMTQASTVLGTAYYMAPEQLVGARHVDHRADQYSVGVLVYELLAERIPTGRFKPLTEVRDDISQGISDAVDKALEGHPEDRYLDIAEFSQALQERGKGRKRGSKSTARTANARSTKSGANRGKTSTGDFSYLFDVFRLRQTKWVGTAFSIILLAWLSYPYMHTKYMEHEGAAVTAEDEFLAQKQKAGDAFKRSNYDVAAKLYVALAKQGEVSAQTNLGWMYNNGKGVTKDIKEAIKWYRLAADQGNPVAQNSLGSVYLDEVQDKQEAVKWYLRSAAQGNTDAQKNLERVNNVGESPSQKKRRIAVWYRLLGVLAVLVGIALAVKVIRKKRTLRLVVEGGENSIAMSGSESIVETDANTVVEKDTSRSWVAKAVRLFNPRLVVGYGLGLVALIWLSYPYVYVKYVEYVAADAAAKAEVKKQRAIAFQTADNAFKSSNYELAAKLYATLAEQGDASAQTKLGWMFNNGKGVPKNIEEAIKWYELAADQDEPTAQNNLGSVYEKGDGIPQDYKLALEWYRRSAEQGNALAGGNLGDMYFKGNGIPQDYNEASKWYRMAAEKNNVVGQFQLGWMYFNGLGVQQDHSEAAKWYRLAADQGNSDAQFYLGVMYQKGDGVSIDIPRAVKWYQLAAAQGNAGAKENLNKLQPQKVKSKPSQVEPQESDNIWDKAKKLFNIK